MNTPIKPSLSSSAGSPNRIRFKRGFVAILLSASILAVAYVAFGLFVVFSAIFMSAGTGQAHAAFLKSLTPPAYAIATFLVVGSLAAIVCAFSPAPRVLNWTWLILSVLISGVVVAVV